MHGKLKEEMKSQLANDGAGAFDRPPTSQNMEIQGNSLMGNLK